MPFLRPLGLPRTATIQQFLRYSTAAPRQVHASDKSPKEDRNLIASRKASPSYPPPSTYSDPRPKVSRASRRVSHPPKRRNYPTRESSHHQPELQKLIPEPVKPLPQAECAPNLPYFVTRTSSMELPVYHLRKRGGNLMMTRVKKIDGNIEVLRDELRGVLGLDKDNCVLNPITKHIELKGHFKPQIDRYLRERLF